MYVLLYSVFICFSAGPNRERPQITAASNDRGVSEGHVMYTVTAVIAHNPWQKLLAWTEEAQGF